MPQLSELVERKFVDVVPVSDWEIETDTGWHGVTSINQTIPYEVYRVVFASGREVFCADTHIFITTEGVECFAINSLHQYFKTEDGSDQVISVESLGHEEEMYDVTVDSLDHTFYSNGVLSHNTIVAAACILWYTLFQQSKTVAILANKGSAAREVLSRYQIMYENLPIWMQQGVLTWNKGNVELENGCNVFTSATTTSGIRGKSINWLYIDEASIIPNTVAEQFFASVYPTISAGETTKILLTSTPLGYNHFWKFWNEADEKNPKYNDFARIFIPYWEIPGRDEEWAEAQRKLLGEVKFNQEVLCVGGDTKITLKNKETGEIFSTTMELAYQML